MEEERNNIPKKVKILNIGVEDKINQEKRNKILEKLGTPWSWNGWRLEDASENLRRDREIVMAVVKLYGLTLEFASEDLKIDRHIVMTAVKKHGLSLCYISIGLRGENIYFP